MKLKASLSPCPLSCYANLRLVAVSKKFKNNYLNKIFLIYPYQASLLHCFALKKEPVLVQLSEPRMQPCKIIKLKNNSK